MEVLLLPVGALWGVGDDLRLGPAFRVAASDLPVTVAVMVGCEVGMGCVGSW